MYDPVIMIQQTTRDRDWAEGGGIKTNIRGREEEVMKRRWCRKLERDDYYFSFILPPKTSLCVWECELHIQEAIHPERVEYSKTNVQFL